MSEPTSIRSSSSAPIEALPSALPDLSVCQRARKSRDPRFDGRFFIGVLTTGIYCRTICPARMPAEDNVTYFATAAAANDAGFRPCKRCRPEGAGQLPEWTLSSDTVIRGLRMVEAGFLNIHSSAELAARLDVSPRHLHRLFIEQLGAGPKTLAKLSRARIAANLLRSTSLPMTAVAHHAGFGSVSRFNAEVRTVFQCSPSDLRNKPSSGPGCCVNFVIPVRQPYDFDWVFEYLQTRALDKLEQVDRIGDEWIYRRRVASHGKDSQWVSVRQRDSQLLVQVPEGCVEALHQILVRVRRVFDLQADGQTIHDSLLEDRSLRKWVKRRPGLRVPGAWDGFETCVRAILGQQVSVARGTELANKMIERYGDGDFPSPEQLRTREVAELGMPGRRGRAVATLAGLVADGEFVADETQSSQAVYAQLVALEGIGPWTANYIRMRVAKDPDAFPDNDWVVLKQLQTTAAKARDRSLSWQPWRAYALMYIWYAEGVARQERKMHQAAQKAKLREDSAHKGSTRKGSTRKNKTRKKAKGAKR